MGKGQIGAFDDLAEKFTGDAGKISRLALSQ
jgi:hypothetical protein